jgi:hypothetical protein
MKNVCKINQPTKNQNYSFGSNYGPPIFLDFFKFFKFKADLSFDLNYKLKWQSHTLFFGFIIVIKNVKFVLIFELTTFGTLMPFENS